MEEIKEEEAADVVLLLLGGVREADVGRGGSFSRLLTHIPTITMLRPHPFLSSPFPFPPFRQHAPRMQVALTSQHKQRLSYPFGNCTPDASMSLSQCKLLCRFVSSFMYSRLVFLL